MCNLFCRILAGCRRASRLVVCLAALVGQANHASAGTVTDNFNTAHDYSSGNATGTIWDGVLNAGSASTFNASTSSAGKLRIATTATDVRWEHGNATGPFLFKNITGDFDAQTQVTAMTHGFAHAATIMARIGNLADAGGGEDWVQVFADRGFNIVRQRRTDGSASANVQSAWAETFPVWLRLTRVGNTFSTYFSVIDNVTWTSISTDVRADMAGLPVQLGLTMATYNVSINFTQEYEYFSITADSLPANVPEPSSYVLGLMGLAGLAVFAWRRRATHSD
jgi:hypothetical protein